MRDLGNTVVVVEHDEETIREADWVIDLGPGAGRNGGKVVASGTPESLCDVEGSLTGAYLSGRRSIPVPVERSVGQRGSDHCAGCGRAQPQAKSMSSCRWGG